MCKCVSSSLVSFLRRIVFGSAVKTTSHYAIDDILNT